MSSEFRPPINRSDHIKRTAYDPETGMLSIEFQRGGVYDYPNVPASMASELHLNQSAGSYFNRKIKPKFKARKREK